jgi:hypothetical protein
LSIQAKSSKVRNIRLRTYYLSLCDDLIATLSESGSLGEDIFAYILQEHDHGWQAPPVEVPLVPGKRRYANTLKDLCSMLHWTIGSYEYVDNVWEPVARSVLTGEGDPVQPGRSHPALNRGFQLSPEDCSLLFSAPVEHQVGKISYKCLFAVESAAFFAHLYGWPIMRGDATYYVDTPKGAIGVKGGSVLLYGLPVDTATVAQSLLNVSINLPRGTVFNHPTRNTLDAVRTWVAEEQPDNAEYILDVLSTLRLGKAYEAHDYLNKQLLALTSIKSAVAVPKLFPVEARVARRVISMEQRELDYVKVQDILDDSSRVDRVKLWDIAEILCPKYMSYNSFKQYIGYPAGEYRSAAMFDKPRYAKMVNGWAKFREKSLELAKKRLKLKFEDR